MWLVLLSVVDIEKKITLEIRDRSSSFQMQVPHFKAALNMLLALIMNGQAGYFGHLFCQQCFLPPPGELRIYTIRLYISIALVSSVFSLWSASWKVLSVPGKPPKQDTQEGS